MGNTNATPFESAIFNDARGSHVKYFGKTPEKIHVPGFSLHEVFLTVNHRDTLRGLHFQVNPAQPKLLTCVEGAAIVNVVCLDVDSPHLGKVDRYEVSTDFSNNLSGSFMVHVPEKHGLGYRILEEGTKMLYLAGADFSSEGDVGIDPLDGDLALDWGPEAPFILSPRDQQLPSFASYLESVKR